MSQRTCRSPTAVLVPAWRRLRRRRPLLFCGDLNAQPKTRRRCMESVLRCAKESHAFKKKLSCSSYHFHLSSPFTQCDLHLVLYGVIGVCTCGNVHRLESPGILLFTHRPSPSPPAVLAMPDLPMTLIVADWRRPSCAGQGVAYQ